VGLAAADITPETMKVCDARNAAISWGCACDRLHVTVVAVCQLCVLGPAVLRISFTRVLRRHLWACTGSRVSSGAQRWHLHPECNGCAGAALPWMHVCSC
jgi:hypothetical protein